MFVRVKTKTPRTKINLPDSNHFSSKFERFPSSFPIFVIKTLMSNHQLFLLFSTFFDRASQQDLRFVCQNEVKSTTNPNQSARFEPHFIKIRMVSIKFSNFCHQNFNDKSSTFFTFFNLFWPPESSKFKVCLSKLRPKHHKPKAICPIWTTFHQNSNGFHQVFHFLSSKL